MTSQVDQTKPENQYLSRRRGCSERHALGLGLPRALGGPGFAVVSLPHAVDKPGVPFPTLRMVNHDLHLIHPYRGQGTLTIAGRVWPMDAAHVYAVPIGVEYVCMPSFKLGLSMRNMHCVLWQSDGSLISESYELPVMFAPKGLRHIHRQLARAINAREGGHAMEQAVAAAEMHQLIAGYYHAFGQPRATPRQTDAAMLALRDQLSHPGLTQFDAESLAADLHLSVSQMNRRFRAAFGVSPKQYWLTLRFNLARQFLQQTSDPINQIARELGFDDENYFSRWFKEMAHQSPTAYRSDAQAAQV